MEEKEINAIEKWAHKPQIPDVIERFRKYRALNPVWGSLHIIFEDGNVSNKDIEFCHQWALDHGDQEGAELAEILSKMSRSQRSRIPKKM